MSQSLVVPLQEVKEHGSSAVDAAVPAADFPGLVEAGELTGEIRVAGTVSQQDDKAYFLGTASGAWTIECQRCLAPVKGEFSSEVECEAPLDGGPMDLTEEVRQAIALAQPMKTLCRPDCRGLCQVCRKNRNTNPCGHEGDGGPAPSQGRTRLTPRRHKE